MSNLWKLNNINLKFFLIVFLRIMIIGLVNPVTQIVGHVKDQKYIAQAVIIKIINICIH